MSITLARARHRVPEPMTVGAHLAELRRRVLVTGVALVATCSVAFVAYPQILHWLQAPVLPRQPTVQPVRHRPARRPVPADPRRHVRRGLPGLPGHPVAGVAVRHTGTAPQREALRRALRRRLARPLRRRCVRWPW